MSDGGGGSQQQPTNTSTTTSNIPDWAIPFATKNLGKAEALTDINQNPYQTFQGNRVANFNPLQQQAFSNVSGMQTNAGTGNAMNQTQDAYSRSANAGQYNAQNFGNQYGSGPQFQNMGLGYLSANAPNLNQYQMGPADQVSSQNFGQQSAQDYMSPYQQNVTNFQKDEAVRDYSRQLPGMGAKAAGAGAFGGTRHALVASEGQRNLQNQLGGIQAAGSQNAYQNAQQQFNADQARRQQAQLANQQAGLTVGQANLGSALQTQALGSGQSMQAQLANQGAYGQMQGLGMQQNLSANQQAMQNAQLRAQYGLAGQQAGEQSRQFGANYGLQNRQQALAAAGQLGTLGQQQYAQQIGINSAQQQAGAQLQAQEQQNLSNRYQDFLNQQNYPYKQLGFMSDVLRGTPTSGGAQSMYQAPPSGVSQLAGLGGGLGSLFGAYNAANRGAAGGDVRGYAKGGTVALAEGGPTYGDVAPLPGIAALMAAKNINAGKATVDGELGLGADLRELLMASMQLKKQKEEDTIRGLQNQLAQATGMPSQQDTTVKEDVANMLRQEVESSAAKNAPERQGGIAELDTGNLGENYNSGGIVAAHGGIIGFTDGNSVSAKYNQALRNSAPQSAIDYVGAAVADLVRLPGQANETSGFFPITRDVPDMQAGRSEGYNTPQTSATSTGSNFAFDPMRGGVTSSPSGRVFSGISDFLTGGAEGAAERERRDQLRADIRDVQNKITTLGGTFGLTQQTPEQKKEYETLREQLLNLFLQLGGKKPTVTKPVPGDIEDRLGLQPNPLTPRLPVFEPPVPRLRGAAAPTAAPPNPNVGIKTPSPAAESEDIGYTNLMKTLKDNSAAGLALLQSGIRAPGTPKTAGEYAASSREQSNAYLKARNLPTAEESMKERMDNLATAGKEARNNRDVDRWMAAAQGFFTMAGGKSQYAMQNMAEGLGMGTKEFRAVEQDYRKVDQLQKDKAELLKEATRQEARGDFAKGEALRKDAEDRKDKIDAANVVIGERMTAHAGTAMGNAISAKGARDARRDAELLRRQIAAESSAERAARAAQLEQGRTDRAKEIAAQKRTDSYQRAFKGDAAYKGLQEKESAIANLGPRESLKPKQQQEYDNAVATRDALQTQISKRARAIAVRETQADMDLQAEADIIIKGDKK